MKRVAIMGLGLMGASIGLALRRSGFGGEIAGYARKALVREQALALGVADTVYEDPTEAVRGSDLSVLCVPIFSMQPLFELMLPALQAGSLATDVGSTKHVLCEALSSLAATAGAHFVGSHPIAGSEQSGIEAARADLYQNALTLVTPCARVPENAVVGIEDFWKRIGSRTLRMDASEHDEILARTSHLPHMVSSLLASTTGRDGGQGLARISQFCGPGFRDTSRVAEGSPEVWVDIARSNAGPLTAELEAYRKRLDRLISAIRNGNFDQVGHQLEEARTKRKALVQARPGKDIDV